VTAGIDPSILDDCEDDEDSLDVELGCEFPRLN
jgi:hypothetical protein